MSREEKPAAYRVQVRTDENGDVKKLFLSRRAKRRMKREQGALPWFGTLTILKRAKGGER